MGERRSARSDFFHRDTPRPHESNPAVSDYVFYGSHSAGRRHDPLASLMEVLGLLIEKYEDERVPELKSNGVLREDPPET
jgi:hypothetical protein